MGKRTGKPNGRPRIEIDWTEVDKLLLIQCTDAEVAGWFGISHDTLLRICKREQKQTFASYSEQKRGRGKISLRRAMWQKALDPKNTAATIFACKAYLGLDEPKAPIQVIGDNTKIVYESEWGGTGEPTTTHLPSDGEGEAT